MRPRSSILPIALGVLLATPHARGAESPLAALDDSVSALVSEASRGAKIGAGESAAVAVDLEPAASPGELERLILGLARARLEALLGAPVVALPAGTGSAGLGAADDAARAAGAEWLLLIRVSRPAESRAELRAELRAVDPGLWVLPPAPDRTPIAGLGSRSLPIGSELRALLGERVPIVPITPGPNLTDARATRALTLDDAIVALAACPLRGRASPELIALGLETLTVLALEPPGLRVLTTLRIGDLPRATTPSREPIGGLACNPGARLAFGHSGLERGYLLDAHQRASGDLELALGAPLPGVPLGATASGGWILAHPEAGTSRWSARVEISTAGREASLDLGAAFLDLGSLPSAPPGQRIAVVTRDYGLALFTDDLGGRRFAGTSGAGISLLSRPSEALVVSTSSIARDGRDAIRLTSAGSGGASIAVPIPGLVQASAAVPLGDGRADLFLAVRPPRARTTELYRIRVEP